MSHRNRFTARIARLAAGAVLAGAVSLPALAGGDVQVVSKVEPEFPREAVQAGADKGMVKARMTVDGTGEVVRVEILEAQPRRVFDRAVIKTLSQWRFNSGTNNRTVEIDVNFTR
ncbi:MAG TPA: TonB family protein [Usitatibacter sp.]|jgi:protein TonB|nr:TonB family protein [Usitatibacter sp.]